MTTVEKTAEQRAVDVLKQAVAVYWACATSPDESRLSWQSPSWEPPSTSYDWAAGLVRSLLPIVYERADSTWMWKTYLADWLPNLPSVAEAEHAWFRCLIDTLEWPHENGNPFTLWALRVRLAGVDAVLDSESSRYL